MITLEQYKKINLLLAQIEKLESSDSSTMTTNHVCKTLVEQKFNINYSYLDICCGKGTILLNLYIKFWENIKIQNIEEKNEYILSKMCGCDILESQVMITIKVLKNIQKIMNISNIIEPNIYTIDILNYDKKEYDILKKFDVVITNPAYNSKRGDNNQSVDIYPEFIDKAFELTKRYVIMITKSNWMNFPKHKKFREKMINEYNVDKIVHYEKNPFVGTEIKGGVSYFVIDNENTKDTFELNGVVYDRKTALNFLPYVLDQKELKLLNKIIILDKINMSNFRSQGYYNIKTNDTRLKKKNGENYIECHVSKQKGNIMYFPKSEINAKIKNDLNKPKIFTPSKYTPYKIGRIIVSSSNQICSESMVSWCFDSVKYMQLFKDYMDTKVFRVCFSLISNNARVGKTAFSLIPNIDFSKLEKIDDENIFEYLKKYHDFTDEDIQTIEERCEKLKLII